MAIELVHEVGDQCIHIINGKICSHNFPKRHSIKAHIFGQQSDEFVKQSSSSTSSTKKDRFVTRNKYGYEHIQNVMRAKNEFIYDDII